MKKTILLLLLLFAFAGAYAQPPSPWRTATEFSIGMNQLDRNLRLDQWVFKGRHGLHAGIKYYLWWRPVDARNTILGDRGFAQQFQYKWGVQAGYTYDWLRLRGGFSLYGFYDLQFSRMPMRRYIYHYLRRDYFHYLHRSLPLYYHEDLIQAPVSVWEQNVGLGLRFPLNDRITLNQMVGVGLAMSGNNGDPVTEWNFPFLRLGFAWNWGPPASGGAAAADISPAPTDAAPSGWRLSTEVSGGINHIDKNLRLDQWAHRKRHGFHVGVKCTLPIPPSDDQAHVFKNRAYPQTFMEYWGAQFGYTYMFLRMRSGVNAYAFYDAQFSRASFLHFGYAYAGDYIVPATQLQCSTFYRVHLVDRPRLAIEQNLGMGFSIPLGRRLALNQMLGLGIAAIRENFFLSVNGGPFRRRYFVYDPIFPFVRVGLVWKWGV